VGCHFTHLERVSGMIVLLKMSQPTIALYIS
jgi:hypothetical protein